MTSTSGDKLDPAGLLAKVALSAIILAALDLGSLLTLFSSPFGSCATAVHFVLVSTGILTCTFLALAAAMAAGNWLLSRFKAGRLTGCVIAGILLAAVTAALNWTRLQHKLWFIALLIPAAFVLGFALRRTRYRRPGSRAGAALSAGWCALAVLLFLADALALRGLYFRQHLTVGLYTWLVLLTGVNGLSGPALSKSRALTLLRSRRRQDYGGQASCGGLSAARVGLLVLAGFCVIVMWATPGDAVSENMRYLSFQSSTSTREALHIFSRVTDVDMDGYAGLLGAGDCDQLDASIHPGAVEFPGDGIDQNCLGGDLTKRHKTTLRQLMAVETASRFPPVKNVVLLSVDALRYDRVVGDKANPVFSRVASRGVVFSRAYCLFPGTILSMYAAMTSKYPLNVRLSKYHNFELPSEDRAATLFEVLTEQGIATRGIVFHQTMDKHLGITRGMQEVWVAGSSGEEVTTDRTVEQALAFLRDPGDERFLLWIHFYDPHAPYMADDGSPGSGSPEEAYDREVQRAAAGLDKVLGELDRRGLMNETAILFFADHGEELGDHGAAYHGQTLYDECLRIPLVFILPGQRPRIEETAVSFLDLAPTVLDLMGLSAFVPREWEGRSLTGLISGESAGSSRPVFIEVFQPDRTNQLYGIVDWPWKFIYRQDNHFFELYNLQEDPGEGTNVYDTQPEVAARLSTLLDMHLSFDSTKQP